MSEDEITPTSAPTSLFPLEGRCWECILTGQKYLNGKRFTRTIKGSIVKVREPKSVFDIVTTILRHIEEDNDMEHIDRLLFHVLTDEESKEVTDSDGDDIVPSH
jgi:hypothetical protein